MSINDIKPDKPRLIEHAFPLKQASLDSVHEKNVRHGHISTLHIWPARRPLAACRAALIATLLPDPGSPEKRKELCEKIGGKVVKKMERKKMPNGETVEREKEITEGGILHWGRETENKETLEWFRQEIRKAYGGRAPKVLDPFAGGGAIPLEAMRLGCEVTAGDINPVAWFILKCTLEYPQKLAGKTHPLPEFILKNEEFMDDFYKAHPDLIGRTKQTKKQKAEFNQNLFMQEKEDTGRAPKADLAWHVRAWGQWVLAEARKDLAKFYPTYADFEPIPRVRHDTRPAKPFEKQPIRLVPFNVDGMLNLEDLKKDFSRDYLADHLNPRWVAKPTVAYFWARTVKCKNCRATLPLLKTRWLCKKKDGRKRVLLTMETNADRTGVVFGIETNVPDKGRNAAQRREHDKRTGSGTMSRSGAKCPCCGTIMTMQDIRLEGKAGRLGEVMTAVVVDGQNGKEYRLPSSYEIQMSDINEALLDKTFSDVPFGLPREKLPTADRHRAVGSQLPGYGFTTWEQLFTRRQLLALGELTRATRASMDHRRKYGYPEDWSLAIEQYLSLIIDKVADYGSLLATWIIGLEAIRGTFARFAFSWTWDFCETNPIGDSAGCYSGALDWTVMALSHIENVAVHGSGSRVLLQSAISMDVGGSFDLVATDPPYYDAIPYADLMDFFYVWMRRVSYRGEVSAGTTNLDLAPNWDSTSSDGELIDDPGAYGGDRQRSKTAYEEGMARVFSKCGEVLSPNGSLIVVFAHKHPDAWESLVSSIIKAGFIADGSWPIQTERGVRTNAIATASLASSVWLVCKKRPETAKPGWDNQVLEDMRKNIREKLREFWDAGIRGPDFVWAATGPAMEAYSKHPVVKKANDPGQVMTVSEFLTQVRRMVVDFVVGRVLSGDGNDPLTTDELDVAGKDQLDELTAYYLLHRHDFGMDEAPAGACILYAISCGVSDKELSHTWDLIAFTKGEKSEEEEVDVDAETDSDTEEDSGSKVKLKTWAQRKGRSLGFEAPGGKPIPLIDRVHCMMHLWKSGDLSRVEEYLDSNGLRKQELFKKLLQSLIELSPHASEERSLLESISNHIQAKGAVKDEKQMRLA